VDLNSKFDGVAATDRLSFVRGRPFSNKTYQAFTAKQSQVTKAQQKRMKSTKVLTTTVPSRSSCVILPSAGNKEWVVEPPEGKVVRRPLATTRVLKEKTLACPHPRCPKMLSTQTNLNTHYRAIHEGVGITEQLAEAKRKRDQGGGVSLPGIQLIRAKQVSYWQTKAASGQPQGTWRAQ
jgi:hypothetical protein